VTAPVQGNSKHWDLILSSDIYNSKPGKWTDGYLTWSQWELKPGAMRGYSELTRKVFVPVLEKLLAEGAITSYGLDVEDYHQNKMELIYEYFTAPDAASLDKANKALEDAFSNNPTLGNAVRALADPQGHRDFLARLRFMVSK
jgi:hypothetical protein